MPSGYAAVEGLAGLVEACEQIPARLLKSISFDQGSDWAEWEILAATYGINCWFFGQPHLPRQRGQIDNFNRQFRFWRCYSSSQLRKAFPGVSALRGNHS